MRSLNVRTRKSIWTLQSYLQKNWAKLVKTNGLVLLAKAVIELVCFIAFWELTWSSSCSGCLLPSDLRCLLPVMKTQQEHGKGMLMGRIFLQLNPNYSGGASGRVRKCWKESTDPPGRATQQTSLPESWHAAWSVLCGSTFWALDREKHRNKRLSWNQNSQFCWIFCYDQAKKLS